MAEGQVFAGVVRWPGGGSLAPPLVQGTNAVRSFKADYDAIVIDCPPALGLLTVNALVASTHLLIPIQSSYFALEGTDDLLETIEKVRARDLKRLRLKDKDPRLNEQIDEIEEMTSRQIAVLEKITDEKIAAMMTLARAKVLIAYGGEGDLGYWSKALRLRTLAMRKRNSKG